MLLKLLYDFAMSRRLLDDLAFKRNMPVRWVIELDRNGSVIGAGPSETQGSRPNKGKEYDVPKTTRPTGSGQVADFLADDIGAIFGLNAKPQNELNERATKNLQAKHADFWRQIQEAASSTGNPAFKALVRFHEKLSGKTPGFLRLDRTGTPKWMVRKADEQEAGLGADLFTFAVGDILITRDEIREYWRRVVAAEIADAESSALKGVCLVTGEQNVPLARTHTPMITGLPKTHKNDQIKQRGIVGFESDSFRSYGLEKSYNAPTSITASKAYLLALQYLSSRDDHWLSLGAVWLCFWAAETKQVSGLFARLLRKPDPLTIRNFMASPWSGLEKRPPDSEKFYAVTLTAAGPRIIVKDWLQITLAEAASNFQRWFEDLDIQPVQWSESGEDEGRSPLSLFKLGCTMLRPDSSGRFDLDKLRPEVMASLYAAALKAAAPPVSLLKPILDRLNTTMAREGIGSLYDRSRFALLRLIINRHHRNRKEDHMEIPPKPIADTNDPAYNAGRLLSVFNSLQRSAHAPERLNTTIAERYFGSASTNPNATFSILWRLHQHHLKKLRQKGEKGEKADHRIKETITEICARFSARNHSECPQFPRVFPLTEQGRFALGFYHQEAARAEAVRLWKEKQKAAGRPAAEEEVPEEELFTDSQTRP
jgi:CRISPR-associated protein Csd1